MRGGMLLAGLGVAALLAGGPASAQARRKSAWEPVSDPGGLYATRSCTITVSEPE